MVKEEGPPGRLMFERVNVCEEYEENEE